MDARSMSLTTGTRAKVFDKSCVIEIVDPVSGSNKFPIQLQKNRNDAVSLLFSQSVGAKVAK